MGGRILLPQQGKCCSIPGYCNSIPGYCNKTALIKRKGKERKHPPNPPFAKGGDEEEGSEGEKVAEGAGGGMREECDQRSAKKKRNLTQEDVDRMQVPRTDVPAIFPVCWRTSDSFVFLLLNSML